MVTKWTKKIALLAAAAIALSGLAACADTSEGGGSVDPIPTEKATSGEIVWWGFTPGTPVNEEYITAFNKEYPDIKVTWKQTSIDDYDAAIRPALGNTEGLDVYQLSAGSANGGAAVFGPNAVDLSAAVEQALGADWRNQLSATGVDALTIDGELKALAAGAVFSGTIFINQDLFDKYGLKAPTNWDEWKNVCDTFKKNKVGCFIQGAGQGAFNIDTVHAIADNVAPGNFVKATKGELDWTDPSLVKAFELWKKLFDEGIMQEGALGQMQYPDAHNGFMSGKYAMVMMGTWYLQFLKPSVMQSAIEGAGSTEAPFTMMPIYFPDIAGTGNTGSLFGDVDYGQAVSINSQNKGPATTFALWLGTSDAGQQVIADSLNLIPALKKITPDWNNVELVNPEKQAEPTKNIVQAASAVTDAPRFATINADMNQALMDALAEVAAGKATPQQATETLKTQQETVG